jgi:hypothetical protein
MPYVCVVCARARVLHTPLKWYRHVYNIQEIIKQAKKEFMKVKNEKNVEIMISTSLIKNL